MIKAGKYTAALLLVTVGSLLMIDMSFNTTFTGDLLRWWPALIILLGLEYLLLSVIYRGPDKQIGFAVGSMLLSIILSVAVIGFTQASKFDFLQNVQIGSLAWTDESGEAFDLGTTSIPFNEKHQKIKLRNPNGTVKMVPGNVDQIQIQTTLYVSKLKAENAKDIADQSSVSFKDNGSSLEIEAKGKEYKLFVLKQKPRMNMIVTIPANREADYEIDMVNGKAEVTGLAIRDLLQVKNTNGGITIRDMEGNIVANTTNGGVVSENIRGEVKLDTTNGSITALNIQGSVIADTTNGKITIEQVNGRVHAETTNGAIILKDISQDVSGDTTNGSITIQSKFLGGDWKLETTNGNIDIFLPPNGDFKISGSSGHKGIASDFPLSVSNRKVTGTIGNGSHVIHIDTNSGIGIYKLKE